VIPNRQTVLSTVTSIITGSIARANQWPGGPALHFYQRTMGLRRQHASVLSFLASDACVEIIYATLVSWDMNSRGAEIKDYCDFKSNLQANTPAFQAVETAALAFSWTNRATVVQSISNLYDSMALMKSSGRLVSNAKCIHFAFPNLCPPMDRQNTLWKLYGSNYDAKSRFLEVLEFSYDVLAGIQNPQQYVQGSWNTCETKLVDNAIVLM
jgi:hypothetical protein